MSGMEESYLKMIVGKDANLANQTETGPSNHALYEAADYARQHNISGLVEKPYQRSFGSSIRSSDMQRASNPGAVGPPLNSSATPWRAPYGQYVITTFNPGQKPHQQDIQEQRVTWRKPYGVDSSLVVAPVNAQEIPHRSEQNSARAAGEVDPLTGKPLPNQHSSDSSRDQSTLSAKDALAGQVSHEKTSAEVAAKQAELAQQRQLVESRLSAQTLGIGHNVFAGGIGGILGGHTAPWMIDKYSRLINLDPLAKPANFKERVGRFVQDNFDPNYWNRKELEFAVKALDGEGGITGEFAKFHKAAVEPLSMAQQKSKMLAPFIDLATLSDPVLLDKAHSTVLNTESVLRRSSMKPLFSAEEMAAIEEAKKHKLLSPKLVEIYKSNEATISALSARHDTFKYLSDPNHPISAASADSTSRLRTVNEALKAQAELKAAGQTALFTVEEEAALGKLQSIAEKAPRNAADISAVKNWKASAGSYTTSFIKGAGIAGSIMVADHYVDKFIFGNNNGNGIGDSLNSLLVPMAFMAGPKKPLPMILTSIGALMVGKSIGASLPPGEQAHYGKFLRQGTTESLLLGAEFMLPMKATQAQKGILRVLGERGFNVKTAALMGATWAAFRAYNIISPGTEQTEIKDESWKLLAADAKLRSDDSMNSAIDKFASLGHASSNSGEVSLTNLFKPGLGALKGAIGDDLLHIYRDQWLTKPTNQFGSMLEAHRGATILTTAFGEVRLNHGTHIPGITDTPTYLLGGKNLDLGGKAAREFIIGKINIDNAKKQVQANMDKEIAGKKVEQAEIAELESVKKRIEANETKIYGKHDMDAAVKELAQWGEGLNAIHLAKLEMDLRKTISANKNTQDNRYKAKLFRDLATIYLAIAYASQEGDPQKSARILAGDTHAGRRALDAAGAPRGFDGALDCLKLARGFDPESPDITQLDEIAVRIKDKLPANIQSQMTSGKYNPLQIRQ